MLIVFYFCKIPSIVPTVNRRRFLKPCTSGEKLGSGLSCQEKKFRRMGQKPMQEKTRVGIIADALKFLVLERGLEHRGGRTLGKREGGRTSALGLTAKGRTLTVRRGFVCRGPCPIYHFLHLRGSVSLSLGTLMKACVPFPALSKRTGPVGHGQELSRASVGGDGSW